MRKFEGYCFGNRFGFGFSLLRLTLFNILTAFFMLADSTESGPRTPTPVPLLDPPQGLVTKCKRKKAKEVPCRKGRNLSHFAPFCHEMEIFRVKRPVKSNETKIYH